jgi:hypothetical protein|tara:strand:- start:1253 stop:1693 length:441 start_codon:yes stop_codon:yes gene_type:complete
MAMASSTIVPAKEDEEKEEGNREIAARAFSAQLYLMSEESEQMKYGMLGEDARPTEEKLAKYRGQVDWSYLKPHFETGSLYFVDPALTLETVGVAISSDDKESVDSWLKAGDLVKIESLHASQWEEGDQLFEALVVSPFVVCQLAL